MKRRKVWVGLGTAVLVTSQVAAHEEALPAPDAAVRVDRSGSSLKVAQGPGGHGAVHIARAGGEGGEGDEGGAAQKDYDAKLPPALRFYRDIELIRGHLLVGDELVRAGRWAEALPHFLHPSEEIYGKIIFGDTPTGLIFLACAACGGGFIYWDLSRRGWKSVVN